jgi:FMN phosphatase YigB (HAD superfamily)
VPVPVRHAVVFDLFETLITEFDPGWTEAVSTPAERLRVPADVFDQVWRECGRMRRPVDYRDILRAVGSASRLPPDSYEDVVAALYAERLAVKAKALVAVEASVLTMLRSLRELGARLGVISNCSIEEVAAWHRSPLAALFDADAVVFSYDVGHVKPERPIYLEACRRLGVDPPDVVYVGDGGADELAGAARVGMRAYCARWFLDGWPLWRRNRDTTVTAEFPQVDAPAGLLRLVTGSDDR